MIDMHTCGLLHDSGARYSLGDEQHDLAPRLLQLVLSKLVAKSLYAAAHLGIADLLAAGPRHSDDIARAASCHAPSLYRVMRLLSSVGVFSEDENATFALAPMGELLRTGPTTMRSMVLWFNDPRNASPVCLLEAIRA